MTRSLPPLRGTAGVTLIEVLIALSIVGVTALAFASGMLNRVVERRNLQASAAFSDVDSAVRSALSATVKGYLNTGCSTAFGSNTAIGSGLTLHISTTYPAADANAPIQQNAKGRCGSQTSIPAPGGKTMYFCYNFAQSGGAGLSADTFYKSFGPGYAPFGEAYVTLVNAKTGAFVSCSSFAANKGTSFATIYYAFYWSQNGAQTGAGKTYAKEHNGVIYVPAQ